MKTKIKTKTDSMEKEKNKKQSVSGSRREFIKGSIAAAAGVTILPSHVIAGLGHKAPSDKLDIVGVGVGGMGRANLRNMNSENIVALADVDFKYASKCFDDYPRAKTFDDWREMFDKMGNKFDAVMVATADHTHAIVAAHAMEMGKHVYVQKPLTHTVYESRLLTKLARKNKVVTQMGNQGNSGEGIRQICEWIWDGAIGEIEEVHAWTNRPIWPQGQGRPQGNPPMPETLNWDVFLGPAEERPYHPAYTPWNFRGFWDFGTGALGDMACHIIDPVFKALMLEYPTKVQGSSTLVNTEMAPVAEVVEYVFPERKAQAKVKMPEVKVTWWDGGLLPPRPEELPAGEIMGRDKSGGTLFVGSKGKIMCGVYAKDPFLLPLSYDETYIRPRKTLKRIEASHEMDWVRACKEGYDSCKANNSLPSSNFDYSGPLNEMVVMGVVAVRLQDLKRQLEWDGENMQFTNISASDKLKVVTKDEFWVEDGHPHFNTEYTGDLDAKEFAANLIKKKYRDGWTLPKMPDNV